MTTRWITLALSLCLIPVASADTLKLYTFLAPPYQIADNLASSSTVVTGSTVDTIECVTREMGWDMSVRAVPQNRAIHSLRGGIIDGYFAISDSPLLDKFAQASDPIALEKWYFYSLKTIDDFHQARLGAVAGSNEALWLTRHGFSILIETTSTEQLLALLDRNRVDAIALDRHVMEAHMRLSDWFYPSRMAQLQASFIRFAPLHLYLNSTFTAHHAHFLAAFNSHLSGCVTSDFQLDDAERESVQALATWLLNSLQSQVDVPASILASEPYRSLAEILNLDSQWRAMAPTAPSALAKQLLSQQDSLQLAKWQAASQGLVSEVFLMNASGAVSALSQLTSDFWQGDEGKFQDVVTMPAGFVELSTLRFDESSRRFQVDVSTPIHAPGSGLFIGAVTIGLDIEQALQIINGVPPESEPE